MRSKCKINLQISASLLSVACKVQQPDFQAQPSKGEAFFSRVQRLKKGKCYILNSELLNIHVGKVLNFLPK